MELKSGIGEDQPPAYAPLKVRTRTTRNRDGGGAGFRCTRRGAGAGSDRRFTTGKFTVPSATYLNIAAYKFVALDHLKRWRRWLREACRERDIKGSILLSPEGINLFLAGREPAIREFLSLLTHRSEMTGLEVKFSESAAQPFTRMLVKIKREIIAFGVDGVDPHKYTSPKLPPKALKQWLDEGRDVELLDVRNDYEIEMGTFRGARSLGLETFREFPDAVRTAYDTSSSDKPLVMFCTGGIRCEKAGPYLEQHGHREVYQLEGGILKYFEECGGDHYDGDCFVFDHRVAVNPRLEETDAVLCFACQAPLSITDQQSDRYRPGECCPRCHREDAEKHEDRLKAREARIRQVTRPLPGSQPYVNRRPIHIPATAAGKTLFDHLVATYAFVRPEDWGERFQRGLLRHQDRPVPPDHIVSSGERYEHWFPDTVEPEVSADIRILHEDASLVVVHKPAPLPMHPCGRFNRNTLSAILADVYRPQVLRLAHRLDANTTGVVLFSRTREVAAKVQPQFAEGHVKKRYLCRVHHIPRASDFRCDAPISQRSLPAGGRSVASDGLPASTEFRLLEALPDDQAIVEAMPITGRTNQIRIHLWHLGHSIVGDPMYLPDGSFGARQTHSVQSASMCLHAASLRLFHPADGRRVTFTAPTPEWAHPS